MKYFGLWLTLFVTLVSFIGGGKFSVALLSGLTWFLGFSIITATLTCIALALIATKAKKFFVTFPLFKVIMTSPQMTQIVVTVIAQRFLLVFGGYLLLKSVETSDMMSMIVGVLSLYVAYTAANPFNAVNLLGGLNLKGGATPFTPPPSSTPTQTIIDIEVEETQKKLS